MAWLTAGLDRPPLSCPGPQSPPPLPVPAVLSVWGPHPSCPPRRASLARLSVSLSLSLSSLPPVFFFLLLASVNKCFRKLFPWVTGGFWLVRNRP